MDKLRLLLAKQQELMDKIPHGVSKENARRMISVLGIIEEALEYSNSMGHKPWRPNPLPEADQLEELTDMLFFWLELVLQSGFTIDQVVEEYNRKHAVNLERYRRGQQGDYTWDTRSTDKEL